LGNTTSPTGGDGNYSFQWQQSSNNSSWTNISGATSSTYATGTVTATRWYRKRVDSCSQTKYTTSVKVTTTTPPTWYLDADGDGYATSTTTGCTSPGTGYTTTVKPLGDCNDSNASINPN